MRKLLLMIVFLTSGIWLQAQDIKPGTLKNILSPSFSVDLPTGNIWVYQGSGQWKNIGSRKNTQFSIDSLSALGYTKSQADAKFAPKVSPVFTGGVTIQGDLNVDGNITASKEVAAYIAGAVSSDVLSGLSGVAPLWKPSSSSVGIKLDATQFQVNAANELQIKAGTVQPAGSYEVPLTFSTGLARTGNTITNNITQYTHPVSHLPSIITQDASNRFVTDAEKSIWSAKQNSGSYLLTSDISPWAKATVKPSYTYSEIYGAVPTWNQNTTGNAATVNNIRFDFAAFSSQPYYMWGIGADGVQSKVWPTSALSVSYAANAGLLLGRSDYWHAGNLNLSTVPFNASTGTFSGNVSANYLSIRAGSGINQAAKFGSDTYNRAVAIGYINGEPSIQGLVDILDVPRQLQINPQGGTISFGGAATFVGSVTGPAFIVDAISSFNTNSIQLKSTGLTSRYYTIGLLSGTGGNSAFGIFDNYGGTRFWIDYDGTSNFTAGLIVGGSVTAGGEITAYSDRRLKSNIKPLKLRGNLNPVTYLKDGKKSIGFIAQEVRDIYPELVKGDESKEMLSLNYGQLTAVLYAEILELKRQIKEIQSKLK